MVIVVTGPSGLSTGQPALPRGLRHPLVEPEGSLGSTLLQRPRHPLATRAPVRLARVGAVQPESAHQGRLLAVGQGAVERSAPCIASDACRPDIARDGAGCVVRTTRGHPRTGGELPSPLLRRPGIRSGTRRATP